VRKKIAGKSVGGKSSRWSWRTWAFGWRRWRTLAQGDPDELDRQQAREDQAEHAEEEANSIVHGTPFLGARHSLPMPLPVLEHDYPAGSHATTAGSTREDKRDRDDRSGGGPLARI